jgi:hypothetical protein
MFILVLHDSEKCTENVLLEKLRNVLYVSGGPLWQYPWPVIKEVYANEFFIDNSNHDSRLRGSMAQVRRTRS